mgnify:FL=1
MSLSRWLIRVLSVGASAATVALFDYARHRWWHLPMELWVYSVVTLVAVFVVAYGMAEGFFWLFRRERRSLLLGAGEVAALNSVFQDVGRAGRPGLAEGQALTPALSRLCALMKADASLLYLAREDGTGFHLADSLGVRSAGLEAIYPDGLTAPEALQGGAAGLTTRVDRWAEAVGLRGRLRALGYSNVTSVPLVGQERLLGVLVLAGTEPPPVYYRDQELLALLGKQLGGVVDNMRLIAQLEQKESEARELYNLSAELSGRLDIQEVRQMAVDKARVLLRGESAALCTLASDTSRRMVTTCSPERATTPSGDGYSLPFACMLLSGEGGAIGLYDSRELGCPVLTSNTRRIHLSAQLTVGGETLGVLCVAREGESSPDSVGKEVRLLKEVAARTAMALKNAWLHQHVQELAILGERDRIAREMHDSLAQVLGYLNLKARAALDAVETDPDRARSDLREMAETAQDAYVDVREAILALRETPAPDRTLPQLLQSYLEKYQRQSGIAATLVVDDGAPVKFAPKVEVQLVRIIQESLTNVRKHSGASRVRVAFGRQDGEAVITVEDDGKGFDTETAQESRHGFGLTSMRERAQQIRGRLEVKSTVGAGTRVVARLPIA